MGWKQHAWAVAGYGWLIDEDLEAPVLLCADDHCPVLCLPPGLSADESDQAFGWALADLVEQRQGWMALLRVAVGMAGANAA